MIDQIQGDISIDNQSTTLIYKIALHSFGLATSGRAPDQSVALLIAYLCQHLEVQLHTKKI